MRTADPVRDIPRYLRIFRSFIGVRMYFVFVLAGFASIAEVVGIVMLVPLLETLDGVRDSELVGAGAWMGEALEWLGLSGSTSLVLSIIGALFLLKGVFLFASSGYLAYLKGKVFREIQVRLYDAYSRMSYQHYVSKNTGHFVNVLDNQIFDLVMNFSSMAGLVKQLVMIVIYTVAAMLVAWRFGVMAVLVGLVLVAAFRSLNIYVRELSRKNAADSSVVSKLIIQTLQSFKYLAATGRAGDLRKETLAAIRRVSGRFIRLGVAKAFTNSIREPLAVTAVLVVIMVQIVWLEEPIAPILVSVLLFYRGLNGVLSLQGSWQEVLATVGSVEMVQNEFVNQDKHREPDGDTEIGALSREIELRNLHFAYARDHGDVLAGISLVIPVRTSVALVGESGAGKSTVVDILTLMLRPDEGEVLIDGVPSKEIRLASWRKQIGFVSQETVVFDDTIANNISLWGGDTKSDTFLLERIREAARQAHIAHVIESLPHGYDTLVGDRGVRLSGGQRQRLFLARELFKQPNVLILDEATSALDSESEQAIRRSMDALKGRMTIIMIAHRLSTIRNVDKVFVMENGRVVEEGSYEKLRHEGATRFAQLVAMQKL